MNNDNILVVALGGNAIVDDGNSATSNNIRLRETCKSIAEIIKMGYKVVLTHGNGPQVGNIVIQNEMAKNSVPSMPLDVLNSQSQGYLGYIIQQTLRTELLKLDLKNDVVTVITQIIVDKDDEAFTNPTKPIGPFLDYQEAQDNIENGISMIEDSGRGWRRIVSSPNPKEIVEINVIRDLVESETVVISCGGGGIPVTREQESDLNGAQGVIDKDLASELLATVLKVKQLIILTDTPYVYVNYRKPNQEILRHLSIQKARELLNSDQFGTGSMAPKIEAAVRFIENGGETSIITSIDKLKEALSQEVGTIIKKNLKHL